MKPRKKEIHTILQVYPDADSLNNSDKELLLRAHKATEKSYAPYSSFFVGAALMTKDGAIIDGSNFENASFPLCLCAERNAIAAAHSEKPGQIILKMAITARNPNKLIDQPVTPCGACRQVICEVEDKQNHPIEIIMQGETGEVYVAASGKTLLPMLFDKNFL